MCVPSASQWPLQHRLAAARRGDDDVLVLGRQFRAMDRHDLGLAHLGHFRGEPAAVLLILAVDLHPADLADLADRLQLGPCLLAAAEEADLAGVRPGHVLRRHAAGRSRAHLAQVVGLHQRQRELRSCRRRARRGNGCPCGSWSRPCSP